VFYDHRSCQKLINYITNIKAKSKRKKGVNTGADPGFQVRGGALKKIVPSGGRLEIFGVFRVKKRRILPKFASSLFDCLKLKELS
jgi:hypothetical protein